MPQASVKRLIETEKEKLIDLVLDIDNYPKFIPYCIDSKVYERNDKGHSIVIIADLTIGKGIFKDTYKSDVRYDKKNDTIYVTEGVFLESININQSMALIVYPGVAIEGSGFNSIINIVQWRIIISLFIIIYFYQI